MMSKMQKLLVLGVDGMDPRLTRKYVDEGKMPNVAEFIRRGAARKDLVMLGGHPTVTPPMWTTLATGAYACTHGITGFQRRAKEDLDRVEYNLDSRNCHAEPLWNVLAEAGRKTLVFHWPGSSWPPTSDSTFLHVVDGTQPAAVNMGVAQVESEFILVASEQTEYVTFKEKAATDSQVPCVITDLKVQTNTFNLAEAVTGPSSARLILSKEDGQASLTDAPFDVAFSPIKAAKGWYKAPEKAKEFVVSFSQGTLRRVGLLLPDETGKFTQVAIYKTKQDDRPIVILTKDALVVGVLDEAIKEEQHYEVIRNMRLLDLAEDGSQLRIWISAAMDIHNDSVWQPRYLYEKVCQQVGYPMPEAMLGAYDARLISECMGANWEAMADWQAAALHYLIAEEQYEMVFSHFHNIDGQGHMIMKFLKDKGRSPLSEADYAGFLEDVYEQTDRYLGKFLHYLDEGWTIFIVSDHAQVCPEYDPPLIGEGNAVNVRLLQELGFTALKHDENGEELREIDWEKTKAVNIGMNIWLNIKGRDKFGCVDPKDQYQVEEEIMTALYGYRDPQSSQRVIALALRNKDAILLGLGGPECGDIIIWLAEGYNYDHADSLSTTYGYAGTSVSPIFIAAGKGIRQGCVTERIIREVDLTPTMAVLAGVRMPEQCEGAPVYQILE